MKRNNLFALLLLFLILIPCIYFVIKYPHNDTNNNTNKNDVTTETVNDYFPIKDNVKYTYEGIGNEFASYTVQIDYTNNNMIQQRINNGGTEIVKAIKVDDNKITTIFQKGETYYRQNYLNEQSNINDILLMSPLKVGTTWNTNSGIRKITGTDVDVTIPSGTYKAIEVTTQNNDNKDIAYFVKNIGLVKSIYSLGNNEITSSLSKIEYNNYLIQSINFYYPNINDNKLYYKNKTITFKTNDNISELLETSYKETVNDAGIVFTTNTKINKLYLGNDNIVYIDLSKDFINEMVAGAQYESMILQCITNTLGNYFTTNKVIITIDNNLYQSGHIAMEKGEYFTVDNTNTVEIKD